MRRIAAAALLLAGAAFALPAGAQSPSLGPQLAPPPLAVQPAATPTIAPPVQAPADTTVAFDATERWMIPHYFFDVRERQRRAARSKKYPRALPDGITADPAAGDRLPLTMLPRLERLPGALLRDLPPVRPDTDRRIVGKNVVMIRTSTGEVLDVLSNILY